MFRSMKKLFLFAALFAASVVGQAQTTKWQKEWSKLPVFDAMYYRAANLDVATKGIDAQKHWEEYGLKEGRASSPVFDVKYYLAMNKDLQDQFGQLGYEKAVEHWLKTGIKEGRPSHPNFHVKYYAENNADLYKQFGLQYEKLIDHYLKTGIKENRKTAPVAEDKM